MNNNGDNNNAWPAWGLDEEGVGWRKYRSLEGGGNRGGGQYRPLPS